MAKLYNTCRLEVFSEIASNLASTYLLDKKETFFLGGLEIRILIEKALLFQLYR